jgi:hypothetical protein
MNTTQTTAITIENMTLTADQVELSGGCAQCARFMRGGNPSRKLAEHRAAHLRAMVAGLRQVYASGNRDLFIRAVSKADALAGNYSLKDLWAIAMTLKYGPTGTHRSYCNADGTPTAEAIATIPEITRAQNRAAAQVAAQLDSLDRHVRYFCSDRGL